MGVQAEQANEAIWEALAAHFRRSPEALTPEQVVEMTAFDERVVKNTLAVLFNNRLIEGLTVAELAHPIRVTGVNYQY